jgi:ABC-type Fe3+-hydroxamate transport system substrate-binding protein
MIKMERQRVKKINQHTRIFLLVVCLLLSLTTTLLAGCNTTNSVSPTSPATSASAPTATTKDTQASQPNAATGNSTQPVAAKPANQEAVVIAVTSKDDIKAELLHVIANFAPIVKLDLAAIDLGPEPDLAIKNIYSEQRR